MTIKLIFSHGENGNAITKVAYNEEDPKDFDYVEFVKFLFDNKDDDIAVEAESSYSEEQITRLKEMTSKIHDAALGVNDAENNEAKTAK